MAVTKINIYFTNKPLLSSQGNSFKLGYINDMGKLYSLSNIASGLDIEILEPASAQLINNTTDNSTIIFKAANSTITLRLRITYQGYTEYYSYAVVPDIPQVIESDIYSRLISLLPKNVYSTSLSAYTYADNIATATVIHQLYDNAKASQAASTGNSGIVAFNQLIKNIYPDSGAFGWEYFLTGQNRFLYQSSTQYGLLLQHIYRCEINNNSNPYWLTFNISKYIYLWLKKQRYVYVSENNFELLNAFILNLNKLGNCMLLSSGSGGITVTFNVLTDIPDGTTPLTDEEKSQITNFIRQITKPGVKVAVDYTKSSTDLGLIYLGDTYYKDPRQNNTYCIAYNQNILDEALGYSAVDVDSTLLQNLTDFSIYPNSGSTFTHGSGGQTVFVTTTPTWTGTADPIQYLQAYSDNEAVLSTTFGGTHMFLHPNAVGTAKVNYYLGPIAKADANSYNYTVI